MIAWQRGLRDSMDGRWMIRTAHIRNGDRSEVEYELIDRNRRGLDRVAACTDSPAAARAAAEQILAREAAS